LKSGVLGEDRVLRETHAGTPQGSILSPLLSNVALSVLDEHIAQAPGGPATTFNDRRKRRRRGLSNFRLSRYADDWCLLVSGSKADAVVLREEIAGVLAWIGLRLSEETLITHIDEGLDFLGWRIQRHRKRGTDRQDVYTYPAKKALRAVAATVKAVCRMDTNQPLPVLLARLNPMLRGWCAYFRPGVSSATFGYLAHYSLDQVLGWLRRKHRWISWKDLRRRYCAGRWWPTSEQGRLFNPAAVGTTCYRGAVIPSVWPIAG
jgi:RNA-directed DNA polymerase